MRRYQVDYRRTTTDTTAEGVDSWTRWEQEPEFGTDSFVIPGLVIGAYYELRIRVYDEETHAASPWKLWPSTLIEKNAILPPSVLRVRTTKNDCLTWEPPVEIIHIRGYLVRHAPGIHTHWETAYLCHEDVVLSPPFLLCRVPKGRRTFLVKILTWDDTESAAAAIVPTYRGPIDDVGEFVIRQVAAGTGSTSAYAPAGDGSPFWMSALEPAWATDADVPWWTHDEAPAWDRIWGEGTPVWGPNDADPRWATPYAWDDRTLSVTVDPGEAGPRAILSLDVACTGPWSVEYRQTATAGAWAQWDEAVFWTGDSDAAWSSTPENWRPWPGRLQPLEAGGYEFRLLMPGGLIQSTLTVYTASISSDARVRHVSGLSVPANGGTRAPAGDPWRKVVEVAVVPVSETEARMVPVVDKAPTKGPALKTFDAAGAQVATTLDVTLRGY